MPVLSHYVVRSAVALATLTQGDRPALASMLQPGMQLVYASDGVESPPWVIDSVVREVSVGGRSGCVRLRLRINPSQPNAEMRVHCSDESMMLNGDERTNTVRSARPLGDGALLELRQSNGTLVRFETSQQSTERVRTAGAAGAARDSAMIVVLPTTVTTFDSTGKAIRRLRERFSIGLATATGGVFEVADSTQPGGWRVSRKFDLVAIRYP
jgi:hypothetical protein